MLQGKADGVALAGNADPCGPNTKFDIASLAGMLWPWAWRPGNIGGQTRDPWQAEYPYRVGDVVVPAMKQNGYAYRAESAASSGIAEPDWPPSPGDASANPDGGVTWRNIGAAPDRMEWIPLVIESPLLLEKDLSAYSGETLDLTEEESAHARFRFQGQEGPPPMPDQPVTVTLKKGCANGWVRTFLNRCGQEVRIQLDTGGAPVPIANGACHTVFCDGTHCYPVTAPP